MRTALAMLAMAVAVAHLAMWRGRRNRGLRQAGLPPLRQVPSSTGPAGPSGHTETVLQTGARYYSTTNAGSGAGTSPDPRTWMDRLDVHGLGVRVACTLRLTTAGLDVLRGDLSVHVPRAGLTGDRRNLGTAGRVLPRSGVLVVGWAHPGSADPPAVRYPPESGFRLERAGEHDSWVTALTELTEAAA